MGSEAPAPATFLDRVRQGWDLAAVSLRVVRRRKRIILLPLLGFIVLVTLLGTFVGGAFVAVGGSFERLTLAVALLAVLDFGLNLVLYFVLVLVNAAVAVFALELFDGDTPTLRGSLRGTYRGGWSLLAWAAIATTVATVIHSGQILVPAIGVGLAVAGFLWTFFVPLVAPVVLFEGIGPIRAMRRSTRIRRSTWVEGVSGLVAVYVMFILLGIPGLVPPLLGYFLADGVGLAVGLVLAVIYLIPLFFAGTTTKSVLVAVVYRYGTTGEVPVPFRGTILRGPPSTAPAEEAP